jgi:RNA polymerase sigma factor (sigma-70 family)
MRMSRDGAPGVQTVIAAQGGDKQALDSLLAEYLPLIYNIVGRALNGHADVDDVVQETMLRVVRGVSDLRDPAAFRSWLVAVAIRQLHDHRRALQAVPAADLRPEVADAGADFADLTILRLGLSGQRRETAQAARWLDASDQELLALWWLEAGGELDRAEVAAALGLAPRHATVRIARMKEQLTTARAVVRALAAVPRCDGLADAAAGWDQVPGPLWRKRLARHARDCEQCGTHYDGLIPAERLLAGLPLLPAAAAAAAAAVSRAARPGSHHALRRAAPRPRNAGILSRAAGSVPTKIAAASVLAACAAAGGYAVVQPPAARPAALVRATATLGPVAADIARPEPSPAPRPAVAAANAKKGVSAWAFGGVTSALAQSGASWYYTWSSNHAGITSPRGVKFVPMIWGPGSVNAATLRQARRYGHILLGFNEPDLSSQSNMSVSQALRLWPRLMATGMQLGSPAVADDAATPGGWLDRFMRGARARGYRVNFITVHWYGADFATGPAVGQLKGYLQAIHARYHLPIWVTEFALANFGAPESFPTWREQAAFVTASTSMLEHLSYLQRYAWFALPANATDGTVGLFRSGPAVTRAGRAFEAVDRSR